MIVFFTVYLLLIGTCNAGIISALSPCAYADTETSTNVAFSLDRANASRIQVTLSLIASPSNNVEVSIGMDLDRNAVLSLDETDWTFGYDCGMWFQRSHENGSETRISAVTSGRAEHTFLLKGRQLDIYRNLVRVTRRGKSESAEHIEIVGKKPGLLIQVK